jgi:hypothetical protein
MRPRASQVREPRAAARARRKKRTREKKLLKFDPDLPL